MSTVYSAYSELATEQLQQHVQRMPAAINSNFKALHEFNTNNITQTEKKISTQSLNEISRFSRSIQNEIKETRLPTSSHIQCTVAKHIEYLRSHSNDETDKVVGGIEGIDGIDEINGIEKSENETKRNKLPPNCENNAKDSIHLPLASAVDNRSLSDELQYRFSKNFLCSSVLESRQTQPTRCIHNVVDKNFSDIGCISGQSSVLSTPSSSTISSPLSTPTRLVPQYPQALSKQATSNSKALECISTRNCSNTDNLATSVSSCFKSFKPTSCTTQHQPLNDYYQTASMVALSLTGARCTPNNANSKKLESRYATSPYRQLLPIALCILSFATVFSILIVYMDTTEIRHQQFRLNMSRDYVMYGVAQDDPKLIAFLREIQMRKYQIQFLRNRADALANGGKAAYGLSVQERQHINFSANSNELAPQMAYYVANTLGGKTNGAVLQSLTGSLTHLLTAPWLTETLNWAGLIVQPEPQRYFALRKQNTLNSRLQVVHACVSPEPYPKEVTIHNEEVSIYSLLDEETTWFNSRVKCFPLYTIMLALNHIEYDLLSLGVDGQELEILQTVPFDKVKIEIISIHLVEDHEDVAGYVARLSKFLQARSYRLQKKFGRNYFYQHVNITNRTRKKDKLSLKTP